MFMIMMMPVTMIVLMRFRRKLWQVAIQPGGDRAIRIGFRCCKGENAFLLKSILQAESHAAGNQNIDAIKRMRLIMCTFMEALLKRQFEQVLTLDLLPLDFINPELAAFAGMSGNGFTVLAGDGDFHDGARLLG